MSKNILFINFRGYDVLESNEYGLSTTCRSQQIIAFHLLGDFSHLLLKSTQTLEIKQMLGPIQ